MHTITVPTAARKITQRQDRHGTAQCGKCGELGAVLQGWLCQPCKRMFSESAGPRVGDLRQLNARPNTGREAGHVKYRGRPWSGRSAI